MKSLLTRFIWVIGSFLILISQTANAASADIKLKGQQAKIIYNAMTAVQEDGAAGHMYKHGKSVLCRYTNADMSDSNGNNIPSGDPRRYACSLHFNKFGQATPGKNP